MGPEHRPRVLVFAYACEPERGSEPGAGWGLVRSVSEFADCVVLVGPEHGPGIRGRAPAPDGSLLQFIEIPEPIGAASAKRHRMTWFLLYLAWLRRADALGRRLHAQAPFDAIFHATYSTYWLPSPATRYNVPCIWGPVGGAVVTPFRLWPLLGFRGICGELLDLVSVTLMSWLPATRRTWRRATVPIVQNETTRGRLPEPIRATARVLNHAFFAEVPVIPASGRRREAGLCLFVGSIVARKGPRLAVRALAYAPSDVRLLFLGDGHERRHLERLAKKLKVADRVTFEGQVPRSKVFTRLAEASAVVFTGLREEGGIALAEAMLLGVPVIVLAHGGAATVAAAATDPDRVALIPVGDIAVTARRMGEAMGRLSHAEASSSASLLDQEYWRSQLRGAFEEALAGAGETKESMVGVRSVR
jgi:glycosyltransferase involved in cell wall biosynthesis